MHIIAFNGSPRRKGNTSSLIKAVLEGAASAGAETTEVRLHDIAMKGCMGCLSCREKHGICAQKDELSPYLEAIKTCDGMVVGCPIYMFRVSGQMKLFVDRIYSLSAPKEGGGYTSMVPAGKTFSMVMSQGAEDPDQYKRSARWLAGMTGSGLGLEEVGRILHTSSALDPAKDSAQLLEEARSIGRRMLGKE
ncbi:MAG: flavodoxin family protein [Proteobacteria bacterium]|nr:flavodoxin family protein [Pseudomonadota bacterium]